MATPGQIMEIQVPDGTSAGQVIAITMPDGRQATLKLPAGSLCYDFEAISCFFCEKEVGAMVQRKGYMRKPSPQN